MALKLFRKKKKSDKETEEDLPLAEDQDIGPEDDEPLKEKGEGLLQEDAETTTEESDALEEKTDAPKKGFFTRFRRKKSPRDEESQDGEEELTEPLEEDLGDEETTEKTDELQEALEPEKIQDEVGPEEKKRGFFKRLRSRLTKTRKGFINRVDRLLLGKKEIDEELLEELEEILITSDIGVKTTMDLIDEIREQVERKALNDADHLKEALQNRILDFLKVAPPEDRITSGNPHVIMVVGVNGVGKTTTIGKLASRYVKENKKVLLVAADTFRAAAVEQLEIWAERVGTDVIRHKGKSDPSAVVFDGIQAAVSRDVDVVIIDTAGRLHTKVNLMEELKKIRRTIGKQLPEAPHEILLVVDATTGQNAISQAELFNEATELTGSALTKLDGTAKGGIVVGICHSLEIPLKYIGIGEKIDDLQEFDANDFMDALF